MAKPITWVGIDDDKMNLTAAVLRGSEQEAQVRRVPNEDRALSRWVRQLVRESDGSEIRMCYEAGPNGFALMRFQRSRFWMMSNPSQMAWRKLPPSASPLPAMSMPVP